MRQIEATANDSHLNKADNLDKALNILKKEGRFLITCHIRPDGDAIGSIIGLGLALRSVGKEVRLFAQDDVPSAYLFLKGIDEIGHSFDIDYIKGATLIVLDCNEAKRIGDDGERLMGASKNVLIIDHHVKDTSIYPSAYTEENSRITAYIDPTSCATSAIILNMLKELSWPIDEDVANALYTGIFSDTGGFRHSNTTESVFKMAATLTGLGAQPYLVATELCSKFKKERILLLSKVLDTLELYKEGKIALIYLFKDILKDTGADEEDAQDFISYPRGIDTVEVAGFIKEIDVHDAFSDKKMVSVSLRSKSYVDCQKVAKQFGGGGHVRAAGFRMEADINELKKTLLKALMAEISKRDG